MSVAIRNLTERDLDAADGVLQAAYGESASRVRALQRCLRFQPDGWLIAMLDGTPIGMVGAVDYGPFAYVGLMAVHPTAQRQGIGLALMQELLAWLDQRGCPVALLDATAAGAPLYARLGFIEDERTLLFRSDDCALRPERSPLVRQMQESDLPELVEFDTPIFGAPRGQVFEACFVDAPNRGFVAHDEEGQVAGYLFAQQQVIGPWAARTPQVAEGLFAEALALEYDSRPAVIIPGSNNAATLLLMTYGFSPQRSLRHMRRGGSTPPGQRSLLYAQASFALG